MQVYDTGLPAADKIGLLDKAFAGAVKRLEGQGVADDVIARIYENNGDISRTLKAVKSDIGTVQTIWLEQGNLGSAEDAIIVKNIESMTNCKMKLDRAGSNLQKGLLNRLNRQRFVSNFRFLTIIG